MVMDLAPHVFFAWASSLRSQVTPGSGPGCRAGWRACVYACVRACVCVCLGLDIWSLNPFPLSQPGKPYVSSLIVNKTNLCSQPCSAGQYWDV